MPAYDYKCSGDCGRTIEVTKSVHEAGEAITCPSCGAEMNRVFVPLGIIFRGRGFYSTDSKTRTVTQTIKT